eukprot:755226-Hanusia_phi.AAC.4
MRRKEGGGRMDRRGEGGTKDVGSRRGSKEGSWYSCYEFDGLLVFGDRSFDLLVMVEKPGRSFRTGGGDEHREKQEMSRRNIILKEDATDTTPPFLSSSPPPSPSCSCLPPCSSSSFPPILHRLTNRSPPCLSSPSTSPASPATAAR